MGVSVFDGAQPEGHALRLGKLSDSTPDTAPRREDFSRRPSTGGPQKRDLGFSSYPSGPRPGGRWEPAGRSEARDVVV